MTMNTINSIDIRLKCLELSIQMFTANPQITTNGKRVSVMELSDTLLNYVMNGDYKNTM
jgi:hypothetical protein